MSARLPRVSEFRPEDNVPIGYAPADVQPVRWVITFHLPDVRLTVSRQIAEWMVPPDGVDAQEYANGKLVVFMAGYDNQFPAEKVAALPPGTEVSCRVTYRGTVLAEVSRRTPPPPEASER